ncbi:osmotically inducible protein C [Stenotrophomonas panacihumi]|uniref:Osmotically inducible protein C n=1 Tax=Stenotrophomonas panacihumi TaxID=676599 RepID=A0A0R0AA47_9GAMM|nr:OsmC family protein [Stenotrophomonas panacihumi]KRG41820.1 osmotically inducible protein C [Stenotrophomonas panacihumi]PTN56203.1 OsmC family peroxiredoxin [Stenotrophomonas panacihumi]
MAHARVTSLGPHYAHRITSGHHELVADEPPALGGQDAGMAPFDLYLSSLAACTAITLRMYAEKKGWELGEFSAELSSRRDEDGKLHVHRILHATGVLDEAQWEKLLDVVARTPVTLVMREGAVITSARG